MKGPPCPASGCNAPCNAYSGRESKRTMKTSLAILTSCLVLFAAGTTALFTWQYLQNQQLTTASAQLALELEQSQNRVTSLTEEKTDISEKQLLLEAREQELRERVDSLETAAKSAAQAMPRPYRVRAFVGQESVGEAWIVPHNVTRDPESGRYTFEPVLAIDESSKNHFTVHHTNVVERDIYTTEIYDRYDPYPYYYYGTVGRPGFPGGSNRPPVSPRPPSQSRTTVGRVSQPDARARVFAPPMSIVNSRPQVVGRHATSPINQRVFAP